MNAIDILDALGTMGLRFRNQTELDSAILYFDKMIRDERVITIEAEGHLCSIVAYSVTDDPDTFLKKETWDYKPHDIHGRTVYFEKLVSKTWNKEIRNLLETIIISKYPQSEYGIWHRYGRVGDRKVTYKRRMIHV